MPGEQNMTSERSPAPEQTEGGQDTATPIGQTPPRRITDDPRARLALERKNHAASPAAATGAGHAKAAHENAKQGKREKKVRW